MIQRPGKSRPIHNRSSRTLEQPPDTPSATLPAGITYLATPYSLYAAGRNVAFRTAARLAARLIRRGITIYSPITHCHPIARYGALVSIQYDRPWLSFDEAMLAVSSVLLVAHMDGWEKSDGMAHEIKFFERKHKPIFDLDPKSLFMARRRELKSPRDRIDGTAFDEVERVRKEWLGVRT